MALGPAPPKFLEINKPEHDKVEGNYISSIAETSAVLINRYAFIAFAISFVVSILQLEGLVTRGSRNHLGAAKPAATRRLPPLDLPSIGTQCNPVQQLDD